MRGRAALLAAKGRLEQINHVKGSCSKCQVLLAFWPNAKSVVSNAEFRLLQVPWLLRHPWKREVNPVKKATLSPLRSLILLWPSAILHRCRLFSGLLLFSLCWKFSLAMMAMGIDGWIASCPAGLLIFQSKETCKNVCKNADCVAEYLRSPSSNGHVACQNLDSWNVRAVITTRALGSNLFSIAFLRSKWKEVSTPHHASQSSGGIPSDC